LSEASGLRVVVLISGEGRNLQALIDHAAAGHLPGRIVAVISNRADAFGLQRPPASPPRWCRTATIPTARLSMLR
jgi:folate-dependent phosphoribosylglycinamide formyltransferase PurN